MREKTSVVKQGLGADMFQFHQLIKSDKPDLIFGNTYAKYIARDEDIPLIRIGFPIYDRVGHQYFPDRRLPRGAAAAGEDSQRPSGPAGPRRAGRKL